MAPLSLLLAACGGDDDTAQASAQGNSPPSITGTPATVVLQGNTYLFAPDATDTDGNTLTFSIANRPPWAAFNTTTGRLSGTPSAAQIGTYNNIAISVSDGQATVSLAPFSINVTAVAAGSAILTWLPPTQNTDGSPLTNLSGYGIYWGTTQGIYTNSVTIDNPGLSSYVVDQLTPARWFFVVTALSTTGIESSFSNVASKTIL